MNSPTDTLEAEGWTIWRGGENPAPRQRVRVITRTGRECYALSGTFWWGRHHDEDAREAAPENRKNLLKQPQTIGFTRHTRKRHNEIIAYRHDTETPITRTTQIRQTETAPILDHYRNVP